MRRRGRAARGRPGGRHVDDLADGLAPARRAASRPRDFVEAPVSGSKPKAEAGTLTIFGGGEPAAFERARPLFDAMGELIVQVGPLGHGQLAKLLTNTMGAVNAAVLAEAVRTAKAAGLDPDAFLEVAGGSAGASAMLNLKGPPMFEESCEPALFKLEHMLKDVRHTLEEAHALGIELQLPTLRRPSTPARTRPATARRTSPRSNGLRDRTRVAGDGGRPPSPYKPRLRGVVHQWSFCVALVACVALVGWRPRGAPPPPRSIYAFCARGPARHQRALPPRHLAAARTGVAAPARPLDDLRADRRHLHPVRAAGAGRARSATWC